MDPVSVQEYCHTVNYCYACFLVDEQDPETLCNGLCYNCHGSVWDKIKHSFSLETLKNTLLTLSKNSKWFSLYTTEYSSRCE